MPALEKNHIYRSTIEGYSSEGLGVARIDGQVVFVHDAVRGEDCDILVMKVRRLRLPPSGLRRGAVGQAPAGSGCPDPIGRQQRDRGGNLGRRTAPALPQ